MGMRELGQNVSRVLDRVKRGEELVVTEHGEPIASLIPHRGGASVEELIARGQCRAARERIDTFLHNPIPEPVSPRPSEVLRQMREAER